MQEWSEKYVIGLDRIDHDHQAFFCLVRDFEKAVTNNADNHFLGNILDEVVLYAKFHFRSEENVMEEIGYPDLEEHKLKHLEMIDRLQNKVVGLSIGSTTRRQVQEFLTDWLVTHTTDYDWKIAEFQRNRMSEK